MLEEPQNRSVTGVQPLLSELCKILINKTSAVPIAKLIHTCFQVWPFNAVSGDNCLTSTTMKPAHRSTVDITAEVSKKLKKAATEENNKSNQARDQTRVNLGQSH